MNRLLYCFINAILITVISSCFSNIFAGNQLTHKNTINILTWWGYLNYPQIINSAEKKCGVKISFDEYFSNDEFLRRWEGQKDQYDVIIFSDILFNSIKYKIPRVYSSTLSRQSAFYNPVIKSHYNSKKYPNNIIYFIHAMTGFLWNPDKITLSNKDSIITLFAKAKHNYVVIIDDPMEANNLVKAALNNNSRYIEADDSLTIRNFKKMSQDANVYITNNYNQIYKKSDFAFSFSWSGEAVVNLMQSKRGYKFLIHPKLSYISSDLIAQTSHKSGAQCVSQYLTSEDSMAYLQEKDFYFSPYTNYSNIKNPAYREMYIDFVTSLPKLPWIDSINENNFQKINKSWQLTKLFLNNNIRSE